MLAGSQTHHLMKGVSEPLAGRIRIIEMPALSLREITGKDDSPRKYVPSMLKSRDIDAPKGFDLWRHIHRGSMPELQDPDVDWDLFYTDYERAYLERDVRDLVNVKNEAKFYNFMVACAARTGQLLNASDIGDAIDADHKTAKNFGCREGMADYEVGFGHVICQTQEPYLLTENVEAVPVWAI